MAIVYVGRDLKLQRTVAIKVMDPRLALAQGMADRFLQEARIAAFLQHPNIIVVHDIQHSEDLIFFVMALIEGGALDELLRAFAPLPIEQLRWILLQASRALAHAHSEGIIHRDVKPANILVNLKGDVVLTDFGIAKAVGGNGMTKSGTQIGTPTYMSPEQFSDKEVGAASDQYALGVTAYQLITGQPPFSGDLYHLIAAHGSRAPQPIRDLRPDCPAYLANAVMRMLEKEPAARWPSLDDLDGVFGAGMAIDGGPARKQLAKQALHLQQERASTIAALTAKAPISPVPLNASRTQRAPVHRPDSLLVRLSPPGATVFVGGTLALEASVTAESGDPMTDGDVVWTTSDASVVSVNASGRVTGMAPGTAAVRATVHESWQEASIRVEPAPIVRITVTQPRITMRVGDSVTPAIQAVDANGMHRSDVMLSWVTRAPSIAALDAPGTIRAVTPGEAIVDVSVGNIRRQIEVVVLRRPITSLTIRAAARNLELGDARALTVDARDDLGNPVQPQQLRWSSSQPSIIHVDSAGTALAIGAGVSTISAYVDDVTHEIELEAIEAPVGAIELSLPSGDTEVGETVPIALRVFDDAGNTRSSAGIRIWSSAPAVAEVDSQEMVVRALAVGTVQIHAAAEASEGAFINGVSAALTIAPVSVQSVEVEPATIELERGSVTAMSVRCVDRHGRTVRDASATSESSAPSIVSVDSAHTIRGLNIGSATLRVWVTNVSGAVVETSVPVRIRRAGAAHLSISPRPTSLVVGHSLELLLSAFDATGAEINNAAPAWSSADPSIARVVRDGTLSAVAAGRTTITVEFDGKSEHLEIVIVAAPLRTLIISRPSDDALAGIPVMLAVQGIDSNGMVMLPLVQWNVTPSDNARITDAGVFTALRAGEYTVCAILAGDHAGGVSEATMRLPVRNPRIESLMPARDSVSLKVGKRTRVDVNARLERLPEPQLANVAWTSGNEAIVRVLPSGELEAVSPGTCQLTATTGNARATLSVTVSEPAINAATVRQICFGAVALIVLVGGAYAAISSLRGTGNDKQTNVATGAPDGASGTAANSGGVTSGANAGSPPPTAATLHPNASNAPPAPNGGAASVEQNVATVPNSRGGIADLNAPIASDRERKADSARKQLAVANERSRKVADSVARAERARVTEAGRLAAAESARRLGDSVRIANAAAAAKPSAPAPAPVTDAPNADDVHAQAEQLVNAIRSGSQGNEEIRKLLDGSRPSVTLVPSSAVILSQDQGRVHAQLEILLSSYNAGGSVVRRAAKVTYDVVGRRGAADVRNVQFGPLTKP
jgi:uncharacterized protein YjdB